MDADVSSLSISELRRTIVAAGLDTSDCLERSDLEVRNSHQQHQACSLQCSLAHHY